MLYQIGKPYSSIDHLCVLLLHIESGIIWFNNPSPFSRATKKELQAALLYTNGYPYHFFSVVSNSFRMRLYSSVQLLGSTKA